MPVYRTNIPISHEAKKRASEREREPREEGRAKETKQPRTQSLRLFLFLVEQQRKETLMGQKLNEG